ncbi:MAG: transcription termination factor NusA [Eubacteriales bacterium]|nr:transcription termination factor NusA [Eubacteriales bacterium]
MSAEMIFALEQLEREKGLDKEIIIEAIEAALVSAYRKNFGATQDIRVDLDRTTGEISVFMLKKVVSEVNDELTEISLEEAQKKDESYAVDDIFEIEATPRKFGRIAAQTAKQVIVQRIREAERDIIFDEFLNKEGEIITGVIQRVERNNIIVDLGRTEAVLLYSEQVPGETFKFNERIKMYVLEVKKTPKGPQIVVSRTHPGLVKRLFELEVPEIHDGTVEIKNIAREAGSRTKIAVFSRDSNVDPVGACVGQKGTRVQTVVDELRGEKIDIIRWSSNVQELVSASLSPAKVIQVSIDDELKTARVTVPDFQLSLAIGKEGQNARLAAKLTGWKIDIKSESQLRAAIEQHLLNFDSNYSYDEDEEDEYTGPLQNAPVTPDEEGSGQGGDEAPADDKNEVLPELSGDEQIEK